MEAYLRNFVFKDPAYAQTDRDRYWRSPGKRWRLRANDPLWDDVQRLILVQLECELDDLPKQVVIASVQPWEGLLTCHTLDDESRKMLWEIGLFDIFYEHHRMSSWERIIED